MDVAVLGLDLRKNSCSVVGLDGSGKVVLRRRMQRKTIVGLAAKLSPCIIAMEACCGAHHLGRVLSADGHTVRLMSPEYVRPYVKAQKNDDRDAEAIAEAATRPTMRFVALKSEEQLDMQTLHRVRDRAVGERTSLMNQVRAILLERGVIVPQGRAKLRLRLAELMRQGIEQLSSRIRLLIEDMLARWQALDERIAAFDAEFSTEAKQNEAMRRLTSIPGIGALNATALVAAVGDAQTFARARNLAAWLGLVPRQATIGGKPRLLGITKRGSKYLRKMLIQGARAALPTLSRSPLDAPYVRRQMRFDPSPLLVAQPKQVPAHNPDPLPKTNQDRIVRAKKLMSSDPKSNLRCKTSQDTTSGYAADRAASRSSRSFSAASSVQRFAIRIKNFRSSAFFVFEHRPGRSSPASGAGGRGCLVGGRRTDRPCDAAQAGHAHL